MQYHMSVLTAEKALLVLIQFSEIIVTFLRRVAAVRPHVVHLLHVSLSPAALLSPCSQPRDHAPALTALAVSHSSY